MKKPLQQQIKLANFARNISAGSRHDDAFDEDDEQEDEEDATGDAHPTESSAQSSQHDHSSAPFSRIVSSNASVAFPRSKTRSRLLLSAGKSLA